MKAKPFYLGYFKHFLCFFKSWVTFIHHLLLLVELQFFHKNYQIYFIEQTQKFNIFVNFVFVQLFKRVPT